MPLPPPAHYDVLCMGYLSVSNGPLPGQSFRASGDLSIGSLGCPTGNSIVVGLFDDSLTPLKSPASVDFEEDKPGSDVRIWTDAEYGSLETWVTHGRAYVGGVDHIDSPFYVGLHARYEKGQISLWPVGDPSVPVGKGVQGLLSATLCQTVPLPGQQSRVSGNFNTYDHTGPTGGTITFEIRYARKGTDSQSVDPWQCPAAASDVTVDIMQDVPGGTDQRIWSGIRHGSTVDYASSLRLYVNNPSPNVEQDFFILAYRS